MDNVSNNTGKQQLCDVSSPQQFLIILSFTPGFTDRVHWFDGRNYVAGFFLQVAEPGFVKELKNSITWELCKVHGFEVWTVNTSFTLHSPPAGNMDQEDADIYIYILLALGLINID